MFSVVGLGPIVGRPELFIGPRNTCYGPCLLHRLREIKQATAATVEHGLFDVNTAVILSLKDLLAYINTALLCYR